jgi:hypothetical protein
LWINITFYSLKLGYNGKQFAYLAVYTSNKYHNMDGLEIFDIYKINYYNIFTISDSSFVPSSLS